MLGKKGFIPLIVWGVLAVGGLVAGGYALTQFNKVTTSTGWLGLPVFAWVVIILFTLILLKSRR